MNDQLRQAAQQALEALIDASNVLSAPMFADAAAVLRTALEQQAKPVAWGVFENNLHDMFFTQEEAQEMAVLKGTHAQVRPLYTSPPQRELESTTDMMMDLADRLGELPDDVDPRAWGHLLVYAPQRQWVGLTPEEVKHLYPYGRSVWGKETFEAIEKALKAKNNG